MGEKWRDALVFWVNGKRHEVAAEEGWPTRTLLEWLRTNGLTGTKLGCGEGGCGACTCVVSSWDSNKNSMSHVSVNACLFPLMAADYCSSTYFDLV